MSAAKHTPDFYAMLNALTSLRIAHDRWQSAKRETNVRRDRALRWMEEKPFIRTIGEASSYVGMSSAMDDQKAAKRVVLEAVESLLHLGFDIEMRKEPS